MVQPWIKSESVLAQRLNKGQIAGFFRKQILLKQDEEAILEKNGQIVEKLGTGKHSVGNIFSKGFEELILIDSSIKSLKREVKDLWASDDKKLTCEIELKLRVKDSEKLFTNLIRESDLLALDEIWQKLYPEITAKVLIPEVKKHSVEELYGSREIIERMRASIEVELKKTLELWGIELIALSLIWKLPPEYEEYLKTRGFRKEEIEAKEYEAKEKLKEAVTERELLALKPKEGKEETLAELEKERVKREFELEIERKETARDIEDALEALRLKEIKDKQKILRDAKRKELGLPLKTLLKEKDANIEEIDKLRKRYHELQQMKEATEKNYYKNKIDQETFKRLMQEYEQKLTEIEIKIKNLKEGKG